MKRKYKIGIVIDRFNVGGVEKIAIEQAKSLRENGEDAVLVVLRRKGVIDDAFLDLRKDVPTLYLDDRLPELFKLSFKFPVFSFFSFFHITYPFIIPFFIRSHEFDYLIVHGTYTAFSAIGIKNRKGISFSTYIWDPISYILDRVYTKKLSLLLIPLKKFALYLDHLIIKNSDVVIAGGDAHNKFIHTLDPNKEIKIITPSVHPINKQQKKYKYILMVTAWKQGKNPEYIFEIVKRIPDIQIKMVGKWLDEKYKESFLNLVKQHKYEAQIEIVGEVTENQLKDYYAKALILLQTNDDRGFGMPALEAAGHGTTFIIPKGQGVCNLFTDKVEGFYTSERDTKQITEYLQMLLKDHTLATKMGETGLKKVLQYYSWRKHAEELVSLVERNTINEA